MVFAADNKNFEITSVTHDLSRKAIIFGGQYQDKPFVGVHSYTEPNDYIAWVFAYNVTTQDLTSQRVETVTYRPGKDIFAAAFFGRIVGHMHGYINYVILDAANGDILH